MTTVRTSVGKRLTALCAAALAVFAAADAFAAPLAISDTPIFLNNTNAEPLVMLALSNDEQLYHKAYTDFDDVDGDGVMDSTYKDSINYYGYFDPTKCYSYSGATDTGNFQPTALAGTTTTSPHDCSSSSGGGRWSGNFLNWATMTRMDALRKVLFGGYRSTDTATNTILERAYLPSDNHAWTKFYAGSDLAYYTPYSISTYASGITICNVTPSDSSNDPSQTTTTSPRLRVANGQWTEWAAQESKQCLWQGESNGGSAWASNASNPSASPTFATNGITELTVRVQACVSTLIGAEHCKAYGTSLKPIGLLQDFADADQLKIRFGLMTGTYGKRKSGGELRKNIARFTDEVNASNGTFTSTTGIVKSINLMRISKYNYGTPGYSAALSTGDGCPSGENTWSNGACSNWGNPVGEMFLEALRYYVGGKTPNADFTSDDTGWIAGLTSPSWVNPYGTASTSPVGGGGSVCAKPNVLAVSTGVTSFDAGDTEYGSSSSGTSSKGAADIPGLTVAGMDTQTDNIGSQEGINTKSWYVGSLTGGSPSDVCTAQTVTSLSSVSGICPEAAGLQGSFKVAGLAYYAHLHSMQTVSGKATPPVDTYAVSLSPPTPSLKIPVNGSTITVIPAGYNIRDSNAMQLINFRVISQAADNSSGLYFMNYENAPSGSDYDNDMKGYLAYGVGSGGNITIEMWLTGSSAGAVQTMGYTITGVQDPGTYYLLANDSTGTGNPFPQTGGQFGGSRFFSSTAAAIDTVCGTATVPAAGSATECYQLNWVGLGNNPYLRGLRTHAAGTGSTTATGLLKQPLWYAAKYGGFKDINSTGVPANTAVWDGNGDGIPDNYFFVTNATNLETQLGNAFNAILSHSGSASSASVNSGSISSTTRVFQAKFDTKTWTGQLLAYQIESNGAVITDRSQTPNDFSWEASQKLPAADSRAILTVSNTGVLIPFRWSTLYSYPTGASTTMQNLLNPDGATPTVAQNRLNYLRGDQTMEESNAGPFRNRDTPLGDIVDSAPVYMAKPPFLYRDSLETKTYSSFRTAQASRTPMVYVGANDGMLHAFDAETNTALPDPSAAGTEKWAFIPSVVLPNLYNLPNPNYSHQYFVDGTPVVVDAFFNNNWHTVLASGLNKGGREVFALDVTNPTSITEGATSNVLLWEFTSANDADLGYTYSRPAIVRMHNGKWAAIFGNGYNGTGTGHGVLFILDVQTGGVLAKLDTQVGTAATPNGLATPAAVDLDGDGIIDYVYAGDLQGNMWKFDVRDTTASNWKAAYTTTNAASQTVPAPLYTAQDTNGNPQPITSRPQVGFGPGGVGMIVLFGTGKFIESTDRTVDTTNPRPQSLYGIFDANSGTNTDLVASVVSRTATSQPLQVQSIIAEQSVSLNCLDSSGNATTCAYNVRAVSHTMVDTTTKKGWYLDLLKPPTPTYEGEKSVNDPVLRNGKVIFTTTIPDPDVCAYGGRSWVMELDAMSGGQLGYSPFDLNNDKNFGSADMVTVTLADGSTVTVPASGLQSTGGLLTKPGIVASADAEYAISPDTSGGLEEHRQNPGPGATGRQSWRQIR